MYIGRSQPADCSPTRPKSRDEDIQRRSDAEAAGRLERDAARRASDAAANKALQSREDDKRIRKIQEDYALKAGAEKAILQCDQFKSNPRAMDREQEALCTRHWSDKANRTLKAQ
ncbi:MAG: hypothetical protein ACHQ7H_03980 [Candidatus Rokuibacteriota bacterium]|jgi:hypothetical protein